LIAAALVALVFSAVLGVAPTRALAATTDYLTPFGSGTTCTQGAPCSLSYWISTVEPTLVPGDVTILEGNDGTYGTSGVPTTTEVHVPAGVTLEGDPTQARPVLYITLNSPGVVVGSSAVLSDIDVEYSGDAIAVDGAGSFTRVIADGHSSDSTACFFTAGASMTDSVCNAAFGVNVSASGSGPWTTTLRNDVIYGSNEALSLYSVGPAVQYTISNSIIRSGSAGPGSDMAIDQSSGTVQVTLDHSNYASVDEADGATATPAGTATNQTAAPAFVNVTTGDFHEAAGSPTIDAGTDSTANGPLDLDANTRDIGTHTDIGAYEFLIAPAASTTAATAVTGSGATLNATTNPDGLATTDQFQYGSSVSYASTTTISSAGSAASAANTSTTISGLSAGTTYHYRVLATNAVGTTYGADQTFTTLTASLSALQLSASTFAPAKSGPTSALAKRHKANKPTGTTISYTLNEAANVTFTITESEPGRIAHARDCVKPTRATRHATRCTRTLTEGSFTAAGNGGPNRLHFSGRLSGRPLREGHYTLIATPTANTLAGPPQRAPFKIS
jgi:hypothetical protein